MIKKIVVILMNYLIVKVYPIELKKLLKMIQIEV